MLHIETEQEDDGRWIAEVAALPGVLAYGATRAEAIRSVQALALRVVADEVEAGRRGDLVRVEFDVAQASL
ncbi:MAG: type II toxin-antitoxin system HicB family antitoxin [Deltaproteobacteria bacterium]|nr:type II toxin-antitoxin system HicB family antitoxin [Deltaproteobacteria bacterium]